MTIDTCYESVIQTLTAQRKIVSISTNLASFQTNSKRTLYAYDILKNLSAFPTLLKINKNVDISSNFRNQGNKHFKDTNNYLAWKYYNLSLAHAPTDSENYCLALSNRSAVLFNLKRYNECLQDVETVLTKDYPKKLTDKLQKRKQQCLSIQAEEMTQANSDMLKENHKIIDKLVKIESKNEQYLCASSKLDVKISEEMGRHVIAKEDIDVGEVLAAEEPYFPLLIKSQYLFGCSNCLSRVANLLPCDKCCFALYCSEKCRHEAWKQYHSVECSLMASLFKEDFTKLELMALRTVIKARTDHVNWESLYKTIEETDHNNNSNKHGCVQVDDKWIYDSKYYASIHGLASNIERRSISDIFQKSVTAAVFLYLLKEHTSFLKSDFEEDEIINCVAGLLLHHEMTSPTNMHSISTTIENEEGNFVDGFNIGSGAYAFLSLLNHSCAPNVVRYSKLGSATMTLFALRPIKKGMQILDNYGPHHALEPRPIRHQTLSSQYRFKCECEACINNWPTYLSLRPANLPHQIQKLKTKLLNANTIESLQKGNVEVAYKTLKSLYRLADMLEPYAPCQDVADCQETLKQCLVILEGLLPYEFNQLNDEYF